MYNCITIKKNRKEFKSSFVCLFVLVEGWQSLLAVCLFCVDIFTLYGQTGSKLSNIRAEQSVCTNLDENAVTRSVLLGSKNIREGRSLNIELKFQYTIVQKFTVGTEHYQLFLQTNKYTLSKVETKSKKEFSNNNKILSHKTSKNLDNHLINM